MSNRVHPADDVPTGNLGPVAGDVGGEGDEGGATISLRALVRDDPETEQNDGFGSTRVISFASATKPAAIATAAEPPSSSHVSVRIESSSTVDGDGVNEAFSASAIPGHVAASGNARYDDLQHRTPPRSRRSTGILRRRGLTGSINSSKNTVGTSSSGGGGGGSDPAFRRTTSTSSDDYFQHAQGGEEEKEGTEELHRTGPVGGGVRSRRNTELAHEEMSTDGCKRSCGVQTSGEELPSERALRRRFSRPAALLEGAETVPRRMSMATALTRRKKFGGSLRARSSRAQLMTRRATATLALSDSDRDVLDELLDLDSPRRLKARENKRANMGPVRLWFYDLGLAFSQWRRKRRDPLPLWNGAIKSMEGQFGSGVGSFFAFTRYLFLVNLVLCLFTVPLLLLPEAIFFDYEARIHSNFTWTDVFDGAGASGYVWIFFGGYSADINGYRMDVAYILVPLVLIFAYFAQLTSRIAKELGSVSSGSSLVKADNSLPYSITIFVSYDHKIHNEEGVAVLRAAIRTFVLDSLAEDAILKHRTPPSSRERLVQNAQRVVAWFIWGICTGGSFAGLYYLVQTKDFALTDFWNTYDVVIVLTSSNAVLPVIFKYITRKLDALEHPLNKLGVVVSRIFLLRVFNLYAFFYGLYQRTDLAGLQEPVWNATGDVIPAKSCAGTVIGQEFYKLLLVDIVAAVLIRIFWAAGQYLVYKQRHELPLTDSLLQLVYRQTLIWAGLFFCPILPVMGSISNALFFWVNIFLAQKFQRPPRKRWNQNKHSTFFISFLWLSILLVTAPVYIAIYSYKPNCGPYAAAAYTSPYAAFTLWVNSSNDTHWASFVGVTTNGLFLASVIFMLSLAVMVLRLRLARAHDLHRLTKSELALVREDARFLQKQAGNEVTPPDPGPPAHARPTWDWGSGGAGGSNF